MKCKTLLKSSTGQNYTAATSCKDDKLLITIHAAKGTNGAWSYYLESLLGLDGYSEGINDQLFLDFGQDWYVTGMKELLREIINQRRF